jgi:hypothetical protein
MALISESKLGGNIGQSILAAREALDRRRDADAVESGCPTPRLMARFAPPPLSEELPLQHLVCDANRWVHPSNLSVDHEFTTRSMVTPVSTALSAP